MSIAFEIIKDILSFFLDMFSYIGIVLMNLLRSTVTSHRNMTRHQRDTKKENR